MNLELALQLARLNLNLKNKVRFAWWSAEEVGLLGSYAYVNQLNATNKAALQQIAIYINLDMVASPNYYVGVYDGTASAAPNGMESSPFIILVQVFKYVKICRIRNADDSLPKLFCLCWSELHP